MARLLNEDFITTSNQLNISYMREIGSSYAYNNSELGIREYTYTGKFNKIWHRWDSYNTDSATVVGESSEGLFNGIPNSEYMQSLKYPITIGEEWTDLYEGDSSKVVAIDETVITPAGTFTNVVKVENNHGSISYYAPNIGQIKSEHPPTEYWSELIEYTP